MPDLTRAHRGYEYQDLLVACRLVDMLLGTVVEVRIDEKLVPGDRFDDLTVRDASSHWDRSQFKHTGREDSPLSVATFTADARGLRLDRLVAAAVSYRDGPGAGVSSVQFRVVMRDAPPTDAALTAVLVPASPDPGPFVAGMVTTRLRFDAGMLWPLDGQPVDAFAFLRAGETRVEREDLEWLCDHLVIEVGAPAMSMDLAAPGPAERLLLSRVHEELGAGLYPNEHRAVTDVAEALIRAARAGRQGGPAATRAELLRRTQLRQDFGAVAQSHPVDPAVEVPRTAAVEGLVAAVQQTAETGGTVIATGPPGQGKSWACQQLIDRLITDGWIVAEHYCYLGDSDGDRLPRVMAETVFGSLLSRIADADPGVVDDQRPRFAADEQALVTAAAKALRRSPGRRIALVVDGLDHVTRVQAQGHRMTAADPSFALAEALSVLQLPAGSALIVLSQPGRHLQPLEQGGGTTVPVPALTESELRQMAARLGVIPVGTGRPDAAEPLLIDEDAVRAFLAALAERSAGNALYATYLCREVSARPGAAVDAASAVLALPAFEGTLESYYAHLYTTLGADGAWVADVLALLDLPVTRQELRQIMPDRAYRVDSALAILGPVLADRAGEGGIRVYHESFARYLRLPYQGDAETLVALLDCIAGWLAGKGMFTDPRAFSSLLRVLADAGHDAEVIQGAGRDFVTRAVAAGYPASMIRGNLAIAVRCAARAGDWPAVTRYVEMSRAAETYQQERFDSTLVDYADVPIALLGPQAVGDRLLHDGRPVMPGRAGVQMCAAVDAEGGVAPWRQYLMAYRREAETDNTSYGAASDLQVNLAILRGRLRLSASAGSAPPADTQLDDLASNPPDQLGGTDKQDEFTAPVSLRKVATWLDRAPYGSTVSTVRALANTHGWWAVAALIWRQETPGATCLVFAEEIASGRCPGTYGSALTWAVAAAAYGASPGSAHRLLRLGLAPDDITGLGIPDGRQRLLDLTRQVQQHDIQYQGQAARVAAWLDHLAIAARRDDLGLNTAEALITGPGWYRCWLRFAVALARAEHASPADRSHLALEGLLLLAGDLDPFAGDPRSCDLYELHALIGDTIRRAVTLLDDTDWETGLQNLTEISGVITTTLRGELGGPLPPDELLEIAVSTATPARHAAAEAIVRAEMETGAAGRYYSDLASYRMVGARLAIAAGDQERAQTLWTDACRFLTAYGWHKDITIYELLDPLPSLFAVDHARGRAAVASVQPLCERVPMHTDGKETRHAWRRWWVLLAEADPAALARLAAPALLAKCNMPNSLLHEARYELWHRWYPKVDPVAAAALRLTLEPSLGKADASAAAKLAEDGDARVADLLRLILSRADERPYEHAYTDNADRVAADDLRVAELNLVADAAGVPRIQPCPLEKPLRDAGSGGRPGKMPQPGLQQRLGQDVLPELPPGTAGLSRAIRAWHAVPYDDRGASRTLDRFANLIGYRLLELAGSGREEDAAAVLRTLGGPAFYPEGARLLGQMAEGLERYGHRALAALAHTLTWTRTRGGGGWLSFGGETALDALRDATRLDPAIAAGVVAEETERAVASSRYGTNGITQALILAFAAKALTVPGTDSVDMAFAMWDEAAAVIADRAPKVDNSDDPDQPYAAPDPDDGSRVLGDLDVAFATAALAGLAHAGRETKRRSLLAAQALITLLPDATAPAVATAAVTLSDPATLTWLLCLIEDERTAGKAIAEQCADELRALAQSPYLTVRAIARRLVPGDATAIPLGPSDASLLTSPGPALWTPGDTPSGDDDAPADLVSEVAGARLADAEPLLPGLAEAVLGRVTREYSSPELKERMQAQLRAYRDRVHDQWPDAYLAIEQTVEEALQRTAAGARAARLASGLPTGNPAVREDELARALTDNPQLPLELEATRYPRPAIPAPPGDSHSLWAAMAATAHGADPGPVTVTAARASDGMLTATITVQPADTAALIAGGPFDGWQIIGTAERRLCPRRHHSRNARGAYRYTALEVREDGDSTAFDTPPLAAGDLRAWLDPLPGWYVADPLADTQPLVGIDHDMTGARDSVNGLGLPAPVLAPTGPLIALLGLRPGQPMTLNDDAGPGLALITWRTCYEQSEYYLAWPRMTGCAVVLRPDLLSRLTEHAQAPLVIRDYVVGADDSPSEPDK